MRLLILFVLGLFVLPAAGGEAATVDELLLRWRLGDVKERAAVIGQARALGDDALKELLGRAAATPPVVLGLPQRPDREVRAGADRVVLISARFGDVVGPVTQVESQLLAGEEKAAMVERASWRLMPSLHCLDQRRANISIVEPQQYTKDYDGKTPVMARVNCGLVVDFVPTISSDGRFVTLKLRLVRANLEQPMGELKTPAGPVDLPEVKLRQNEFTVTIPNKETAVVYLPSPAGGSGVLLELGAEISKTPQARTAPGADRGERRK